MKKLILVYIDEGTGKRMYMFMAISESLDKIKQRAIERAGDDLFDEAWECINGEDVLRLDREMYIISDEEPI